MSFELPLLLRVVVCPPGSAACASKIALQGGRRTRSSAGNRDEVAEARHRQGRQKWGHDPVASCAPVSYPAMLRLLTARALGQARYALEIGEQPVVSDAVEAARMDM